MSTRMDLLLSRAGISYRQLDYWNRRGFIRPRRVAEGSGSRRDYGAEEERVLLRMGRLVKAGIAPDVAARIARNSVIKGGYYQLLDLLKADEAA